MDATIFIRCNRNKTVFIGTELAMIKILLVEDDAGITGVLCEFLRSEGFEVDAASGQTDALAMLEKGTYDIVLLDIMLKDGNGFSVCSLIKGRYAAKVIFLTASGDEGSVVAGLDMGADDYISKPFRPRELVSRIKSVLRRGNGNKSTLKIGNVTVNTDNGVVIKNGAEVTMTALEYRILLVFLGNRGRLMSRARLLEEIYDIAGDFVNDNTLTVYIKRIREKIEDDPSEPEIIKTVRGLGYRMD